MAFLSSLSTVRGGALFTLGAFLAFGCAGSVETIEREDVSETGGADGSGGFATGGTAGSGGSEASGGSGGTYVEPECPDEEPPPVDSECDAFAAVSGCTEGLGCYPYLAYPYGEGCGHAQFGTRCVPASTGVQGDFCGESLGYCAPGYMCVVGAAGGRRCGQICEPVADHGCPPGLICGETDIAGFGVCF
jgi:hypothetical protein